MTSMRAEVARQARDDARPLTEELDGPEVLRAHLAAWLGAWPAAAAVDVVEYSGRTWSGWDGQVHPVVAVSAPGGLVVSVPGDCALPVTTAIRGLDPADDAFVHALTQVLGRAGRPVTRLVFRWCTDPAPLPDRGTWHATSDPAVPTWLRGFNGEVLVAFDEAGQALSGVGIKKHTRFGHELAVTTSPQARGQGLAAALVAQAARRVLAEGAVPTYLHLLENLASAKTADASGFIDRGWTAFALQDRAAQAGLA